MSKFNKTVSRAVRSFLIACSFLTILPVPRLEWPDDGTKFLALVLWAVGAVLGCLWAGLVLALSLWPTGAMLRGVLMALAVLVLTGGIHMDGLMDTSDAIFSHRDRETRLKILNDPHAGSFAVLGCVSMLLLQSAAFANAFESNKFSSMPSTLCLLASVPVWSRLGMGLLLNTLPFAKKQGITQALEQGKTDDTHGDSRFSAILIVLALLLALTNFALAEVRGLVLPVVWLTLLVTWRHTCRNIFGGIAGDLLGAFNVLSETALLIALCSWG